MKNKERKLVVTEQVAKLERDFFILYEQNGAMRDELGTFYQNRDQRPLDKSDFWFNMWVWTVVLWLVTIVCGNDIYKYFEDKIGGTNVERIETDGGSSEVEVERPQEALDQDDD